MQRYSIFCTSVPPTFAVPPNNCNLLQFIGRKACNQVTFFLTGELSVFIEPPSCFTCFLTEEKPNIFTIFASKIKKNRTLF